MPKNFVGEPFCAVFQKISDSGKVYGLEGGGEYQDFPSKYSFCFSVPKIFGGGGILQCFIDFGYRKSSDKSGGVSSFSIENCLSQNVENFREGGFSCLTNFGY